MRESAPVGRGSLDERSPGLVLVFCLCFLFCSPTPLFDHRLEFKPLTHTLRLVERPLFSFATGILLGAVIDAGERADRMKEADSRLTSPPVCISLPDDCSADSVPTKQGKFFKFLAFWRLLDSKVIGEATLAFWVSIIP